MWHSKFPVQVWVSTLKVFCFSSRSQSAALCFFSPDKDNTSEKKVLKQSAKEEFTFNKRNKKKNKKEKPE
jgi:hypothetical protein